MNYLVLDVESTTKEKGNPFHVHNKLCLVGLRNSNGENFIHPIEYGLEPYGKNLAEIKKQIEAADMLVGFNIKFDLHWIRRYISDITFPNNIWDCQLGSFILSNQQNPYPSLNEVCNAYGIVGKLDTVDSVYWSNGIDTTDIPSDVLIPYLSEDLRATQEVYLRQREELDGNTLFKLQCKDLLVLQEMEYNGMLYDVAGSRIEADNLVQQIGEIDSNLKHLVPEDGINWNSSDHISAILYGGSVAVDAIIPTERTLKSGEVKHGTKKGFRYLTYPRLVNPDPRSELKQTKNLDDRSIIQENAKRKIDGLKPIERRYSVAKESLRSCKAKGKAKDIIDLLLRRSEMEKLLSTYFRGIPEGIETLSRTDGYVHGQFNQCVARTGRLSSSDPNLQNIASQVKRMFISRYE